LEAQRFPPGSIGRISMSDQTNYPTKKVRITREGVGGGGEDEMQTTHVSYSVAFQRYQCHFLEVLQDRRKLNHAHVFQSDLRLRFPIRHPPQISVTCHRHNFNSTKALGNRQTVNNAEFRGSVRLQMEPFKKLCRHFSNIAWDRLNSQGLGFVGMHIICAKLTS
jgi:hypothetical protein